MAEADFGFGGVDVDVNLGVIAVEEDQRKGVAGGGNEVVIGAGEGVQEQLVANEATVDEEVDRVAVELLDVRFRDEAGKREEAGVALGSSEGAGLGTKGNKIVEGTAAEDLKDAFFGSEDGGDAEKLRRPVLEREGFIRMGEAVVGDESGDVGQLWLLGAEEFLACGDVEE